MGSQKNREFLNFNIIVTNNPPSLKKKKKRKQGGMLRKVYVCKAQNQLQRMERGR